jgi:hypothetical protein
MVILVNYYSTQRQPDYDDLEATMLGTAEAEESLDDGQSKKQAQDV